MPKSNNKQQSNENNLTEDMNKSETVTIYTPTRKKVLFNLEDYTDEIDASDALRHLALRSTPASNTSINEIEEKLGSHVIKEVNGDVCVPKVTRVTQSNHSVTSSIESIPLYPNLSQNVQKSVINKDDTTDFDISDII